MSAHDVLTQHQVELYIMRQIFDHCNHLKENSVEFIMKYPFNFPSAIIWDALEEFTRNLKKVFHSYFDNIADNIGDGRFPE